MRQTGFFHHIGSFLLFSAMILLIVTCISAPVIHNLSIMKITYNSGSSRGSFGGGSSSSSDNTGITFGTFGYCILHENSADSCSKAAVGYNAAQVLRSSNSNLDISDSVAATANSLTKVMILHPVACGMSFLAFMMALGAGVVGSFMAAIVAALTFLVTVLVMITDFIGFATLMHAVNDAADDNNLSVKAEWGACAWTTLVSAVCNLIATVVVFLTCCSARIHSRRNRTTALRSDKI